MKLTNRQLATILAALACYKENTNSHDRWNDPIATNAPECAPSDECLSPLSDVEIEDLCEELREYLPS